MDASPGNNGNGFCLEIAAMRRLLAQSLRQGDITSASRCCRTIGELEERAARMAAMIDPHAYVDVLSEALRKSSHCMERVLVGDEDDPEVIAARAAMESEYGETTDDDGE